MRSHLLPLLAFVLVVQWTACAPEKEPSQHAPPSEHETLAWADIGSLSNKDPHSKNFLPEENIADYDKDRKGLFTKVFGGTHSIDIQKFILNRIHYFYEEFGQSTGFFYNSGEVGFNQTSAVRIASNEGTAFYLLARIFKKPTLFMLRGQKISINSTRAGIIKIEKGYTQYSFPMRIQTLIHEARHSDCSEQLTPSDFNLSGDQHTVLNLFQKKACGHLHVTCTHLKGLENIEACDGEPHHFGAYALSQITLSAFIFEDCAKAPDPTSCKRKPIPVELMDFKARLTPALKAYEAYEKGAKSLPPSSGSLLERFYSQPFTDHLPE